MASPQDIFAALDRLDKGVTDFATVKAINEANDMVRNIQGNYQDEAEKLNALRDVSQGLTRRLAGLGMDATKIEQVAKSVRGPDAPTIQSAFQASIAGLNANDPAQAAQLREIGQEELDTNRLLKQTLAQGQVRAKEAKEARGTINKSKTDFVKFSAKVDEASQNAASAIKLIESGNPLTANAIGTLMARASGERGNLTAVERAAFEGSPAIMDVITRWKEKKLTGRLDEKSAAAVKELAGLYVNQGDILKRQYAETLAGQLGTNELFADQDVPTLFSQITGGRMQYQQTAPQQQQAQQRPSNNIPAGFKPFTRK